MDFNYGSLKLIFGVYCIKSHIIYLNVWLSIEIGTTYIELVNVSPEIIQSVCK